MKLNPSIIPFTIRHPAMRIIQLVLSWICKFNKPKQYEHQPRRNWDSAFKEMHKNGADRLLTADVFEEEYFEAWDK